MNKSIGKIAVFSSGGDAPGMNACIRAVVRTAIYYHKQVDGIMLGYEGMIEGDFIPMSARSVSNIIHRGGTILKTARSENFKTKSGRKKAYDNLVLNGIDGVIAIGGDGTFTGAEIFFQEYGVPMIGIPGTIDNDLYGTDFTLGYDTAVNTAIEAIDKIRDTAASHNRLFFVEVMGRDSGCIALAAGIGGGAEYILLPERDTAIDDLIEVLEDGAQSKKSSSIVIVAEGEHGGGAYKIAEKVKSKFDYYDTKVVVLGHIQRGGSPSIADRLLGSRLGVSAVEALINGESRKMAGMINNKVVFTPFADATTKDFELDKELLRIASLLAI
ncbi:MAG: 6-phosphofructokinase [Bacteroidia bacterium]